eukprot:m.57014 g.57014  ORF g.57014 m.57014 type:complete len:733 (-) comp12689_c0_seq1:74-2272(-)
MVVGEHIAWSDHYRGGHEPQQHTVSAQGARCGPRCGLAISCGTGAQSVARDQLSRDQVPLVQAKVVCPARCVSAVCKSCRGRDATSGRGGVSRCLASGRPGCSPHARPRRGSGVAKVLAATVLILLACSAIVAPVGAKPARLASNNNRLREHLKAQNKLPKQPSLADAGAGSDGDAGSDADADANNTPKAHDNDTAVTLAPTLSPFKPLEQVDAPEVETSASLKILLLLCVLIGVIFAVHALARCKAHYIPESVMVILFGAFVGVILNSTGDYRDKEAFDPTVFFLFMLPPVIFDSGYSLHKGHFFRNIGAIVSFAVFGTLISTIVIGVSLHVLGESGLIYRLGATGSFAFASLISAVDPVATLAIFQALKVDRTLDVLVFGESVLNDAVSIVLTNTILQSAHNEFSIGFLAKVVFDFFLAAFGAAAIGIACGFLSAAVHKYVALWRAPYLECGMLIIMAYLPYVIAEGLDLSGIMSILFGALVMSHYTHYNLSPETQASAALIFRTIAFLAENSVFVYLGFALFVYPLAIRPSLLFASVILILAGRAANIFPLARIINQFRPVKINTRMQFVMWFSGLRGAIAFALALHLPSNVISPETKRVILTTTLFIVIFTIVVFGCSTLPVLNYLQPRASSDLNLGKYPGRDQLEVEGNFGNSLTRLAEFDSRVLTPMFRRQKNRHEFDRAQSQLKMLAEQCRDNESDMDEDVSRSRLPSPSFSDTELSSCDDKEAA